MIESAPIVSIGIPLYNGADFISETILSVLGQTFQHWELIITDDGSLDGSDKIAKSFTRDPRVRFFSNPEKLGVEGNWNRCVSEGRGLYRKLLCHDDRLHPECLEKQVAIFTKPENKSVALVSAAKTIITPNGRQLFSRRWKVRSQMIHRSRAVRQIVRSGTNPIGEPGAVLFRAEDWHSIGGFCARLPYVIDLDFWLKLLRIGDCYYLSEPLFDFRVSAQSWSHKLTNAQSFQYSSLIEQLAGKGNVSLSRLDYIIGRIRSPLNALLRQLIYYWWCHDHK